MESIESHESDPSRVVGRATIPDGDTQPLAPLVVQPRYRTHRNDNRWRWNSQPREHFGLGWRV